MKGAGRGDYYLNLAHEDYYAGALEEPGRWQGEGARQLALHGPVEREAFRNLLDGLTPDGGQKLVQNAQSPHRQTGWDLTFSAPKSVSVLWATAPESTRSLVEEAHRHAVETALTHLEETAGITRRGKGGKIKEAAALTFATFQHGSSRAQDPQLHTHAVLINVGLRRDGTAGALQSLDVFRAKMRAGALYRNELAAQLRSRLGLKIEPAPSGFHIVGVPEKLCQTFSQRRRAIDKSLAKRGEHGAVAAKEAALRTRQRKQHVRRADLFAAWQQVAVEQGWTAADALKLTRSQRETALAQERAKAPSLSTDQRAHESVRTGFEDYPAFVGPPRPEQRPARSQSASSSRDTTHTASQPPTASRQGQSAVTPKISADSVRTGFEDYPDFVEPPRPEQEQAPQGERRKSASSWRRSTGSPSRQHQRGGASRPASASSKQRRRASVRASAGSGWRPYQTAWESSSEKAQARQRFIRIERRRLFRKAPSWSPFSKLRPPVITVGSAPAPRWGRVIWNKDLTLAHLRVQQRRLFPRAPQCSPLRYLSLPMLRLAKVPQLPAERRSRPWGRVQWEKNLVLFKVRVQKRQIFPRAALWTRAARLELPALRLVSRHTETPEPEPARLRERQQSQQRSH